MLQASGSWAISPQPIKLKLMRSQAMPEAPLATHTWVRSAVPSQTISFYFRRSDLQDVSIFEQGMIGVMWTSIFFQTLLEVVRWANTMLLVIDLGWLAEQNIGSLNTLFSSSLFQNPWQAKIRSTWAIKMFETWFKWILFQLLMWTLWIRHIFEDSLEEYKIIPDYSCNSFLIWKRYPEVASPRSFKMLVGLTSIATSLSR